VHTDASRRVVYTKTFMASAGHVVLDSACKQRRMRCCLRQQILPIAVSEAEVWDQPSARDICIAFVVVVVHYEPPHVRLYLRQKTLYGNENSVSINCGVLHEQLRNWSNHITIYEPTIMHHALYTNAHITAPMDLSVRWHHPQGAPSNWKFFGVDHMIIRTRVVAGDTYSYHRSLELEVMFF